jgi:hypothetical protein
LPFPAVIVHGIDNIIAWKFIGVKRQDWDVLIHDRDVLIHDRDVLIRRDGCSTPGRRVAWLAPACYNTTRIAAFVKPGVRQSWRGMESI